MNAEQEEKFAVQVFADDAEKNCVVRVTMDGQVQLSDSINGRAALTALTRLAKMVFKLRNDDAIRREEEKILDEQMGTRPKLRQEILRLKHELSEAKKLKGAAE